jgi:hypothetical protein
VLQVYKSYATSVPYPAVGKLVVGLLVVVGFIQGIRRNRRATVLPLLVVGQPSILWAVSLALTPMILTRTLLWPTALLGIPAAIGLVTLGRRPKIIAVGVVALLGLNLYTARGHIVQAPETDPIAGVADHLRGAAKPQDAIVVCPTRHAWALNYVLGQRSTPGVPRFATRYDRDSEPALQQIDAWLPARFVAFHRLPTVFKEFETVWLVTEAPGATTVPDADRLTEALARARQNGYAIDRFEHGVFVLYAIESSPTHRR